MSMSCSYADRSVERDSKGSMERQAVAILVRVQYIRDVVIFCSYRRRDGDRRAPEVTYIGASAKQIRSG